MIHPYSQYKELIMALIALAIFVIVIWFLGIAVLVHNRDSKVLDTDTIEAKLKAAELELKISQDKVKLLQAELNAYRIIDDWDKRKEVEQAFLNDKDSE